ncbi:hypothetical protein HELRODRAFT_168252 [Helobdella robusta]|uniref:Uncharacterized protein n=1 Tax=Helobdella robusta TaxID=6412 RepID=T1F0D0_HELRO|nr:hypothetical protein HELRODRAFT_168252 [Helobdella robusta]ESO09290.1 hypothetical protein HELRODRAFT_168252 [Helobdella robusta]
MVHTHDRAYREPHTTTRRVNWVPNGNRIERPDDKQRVLNVHKPASSTQGRNTTTINKPTIKTQGKNTTTNNKHTSIATNNNKQISNHKKQIPTNNRNVTTKNKTDKTMQQNKHTNPIQHSNRETHKQLPKEEFEVIVQVGKMLFKYIQAHWHRDNWADDNATSVKNNLEKMGERLNPPGKDGVLTEKIKEITVATYHQIRATMTEHLDDMVKRMESEMILKDEDLIKIKDIREVKKRVVFLFGSNNKALGDNKTIKRLDACLGDISNRIERAKANQSQLHNNNNRNTTTTRCARVGKETRNQGTQTDEIPMMVDKRQQTDIKGQTSTKVDKQQQTYMEQRNPSTDNQQQTEIGEQNRGDASASLIINPIPTPGPAHSQGPVGDRDAHAAPNNINTNNSYNDNNNNNNYYENNTNNIDRCRTEGDSEEEEEGEIPQKQTTMFSFFHPTQEFIKDLNENEMEPEEESSNYIPPTTRGGGCFKGLDELRKRINFSLDNDTKEQNRQMSVDIVKNILPFQDANCNKENIKKDPHPLLKSFMRRQSILNNACRNEEHCTCIRTFMEAYRANQCTLYNIKNLTIRISEVIEGIERMVQNVNKPDDKKTKEYILIRPYCPTLRTIYHRIHLAMIKNNIIRNENQITMAHKERASYNYDQLGASKVVAVKLRTPAKYI